MSRRKRFNKIECTDDERWKFSGIDVTYDTKNKMIKLGGWYDSFVGIEPDNAYMSIKEFCEKLDIQIKDLE